MRTSSTNAKAYPKGSPRNAESTSRMKAPGLEVSPIGIRVYAYWPQGVPKAVFALDSSSSST